MKISQILQKGKPTLSFEVFPPKTESGYESVRNAVEEICNLKPDFMSVTFGAAGTTSDYTISIAQDICARGVTPLAHMTCVNMTKQKANTMFAQMRQAGVENIMALRGDIPATGGDLSAFTHANELVEYIKQEGDFCIGGACYPEGHVESATRREDIEHLKRKVDAGVDFLTTQMFFDNNVLYNYLYQIREAGITVPVIAGVMPVTNRTQIARICSLSGTYLPERFKRIVDRFGDNPDAMMEAGIVYAAEQVIDLYANGVDAVHIYSMNKPQVAAEISRLLKTVLSR